MLSHRSMRRVLMACIFGAVLTAPAVEAAIMPAPGLEDGTPGVQLAAGNSCGPGRQSGWNGVCHSNGWFAYRRACPFGMHIGPYGRRCWPN